MVTNVYPYESLKDSLRLSTLSEIYMTQNCGVVVFFSTPGFIWQLDTQEHLNTTVAYLVCTLFLFNHTYSKPNYKSIERCFRQLVVRLLLINFRQKFIRYRPTQRVSDFLEPKEHRQIKKEWSSINRTVLTEKVPKSFYSVLTVSLE